MTRTIARALLGLLFRPLLRSYALPIVFISALPLRAALWDTIIADSRAIDWSQAGVQGGIPSGNWTPCGATIQTNAPASTIQAAIDACTPIAPYRTGGKYVQLAAGTYPLNTGLALKSGVVLRGMGADKTFLVFSDHHACAGDGGADICVKSSDINWKNGPSNLVNWTGGYAKGATAITLASVPNLKIGNPIILDQTDDACDGGAVVVSQATTACTPTSPGVSGPYSLQGNGGGAIQAGSGPRAGAPRNQAQIVTVTSCNGVTTPGAACSGTNVSVGISPGLYMPNWSASRSPQAWWATSPVQWTGVEDLSMDHSASLTSPGNGMGVEFFNAQNGWVKGVRSIRSSRAHVRTEYSNKMTVRDNYFFLSQYATSTSYGYECYGGGDVLVENNITHAVSGPFTINSACSGSVVAYNFDINNYYTASAGFINGMSNVHAAGNDSILYESNIGPQIYGDLFHGTHNLVTLFRNRLAGTSPACWVGGTTGGAGYPATIGACSSNRIPIILNSFSRVFNVVGNVLGTSGVQASYEGSSPIYAIGGGNSAAGVIVPDDPNVAITMLRWGNYDTVTANTYPNGRFLASEVPSALSGTAALFSNQTLTDTTLPPSFYLTSKPVWWPTTMPWPAIGPDIQGGNAPGGHVLPIPAEACYRNVMGGPVDGMGSVLNFNAAACYGTTAAPPDTQAPSVPTGLRATAASDTQINFSWTAATDNVGVTGYKVYRCQGSGCTPAAPAVTTLGTVISYQDVGLAAATTYRYGVSALDAAGNESGLSSTAETTTPTAAPSGSLWSGILSTERAIDWSQAGVPGGVPNRTTICSTLGQAGQTPSFVQSTVTGAMINSAISACTNGVVFLNAGTYNISGGIRFNNKRNVTLRGAGANQTLLVFSSDDPCGGIHGSICFLNGDANWTGGPGNTATWTAGSYAKGSNQITLSQSANLQVGSLLNLDQKADTADDGTIFQANSGASHNCINCGNSGRGGTGQTQIVRVTACGATTAGSPCTSNTVTITPGLYMPNWRADRSPGAWWSGDTPISGSGVEDLSLDNTAVKNGGGVVTFYNAYGCWAKGIRSLFAYDSHVKFWQAAHNTVRDSYFYGNQVGQSQSYGTDTYIGSDNLVEDNIFQHITVPNMNETSQGDVYAFNFSINNFYRDSQTGGETGIALHSAYTHAGGNAYVLWEGNVYDGISLENFHGPAHFITAFRNRFVGHEASKTSRTVPVFNQSFQRYTNIVGNVLGDAAWHTNYESKLGDSDNSFCDHAIYAIGWSGNCGNWSAADCASFLAEGKVGCPDPDPKVLTTLLRWGNYDTVTAGTTPNGRFISAEVPLSLSSYGNIVPSPTLPDSFYLSGKPSWWPGSIHWPPIGPDVSGGSIAGVNNHAYKTPAEVCFENTMGGSYNDSSPRSFNASACYGTTTTPPSAPVITQQPANASVQEGQSASFSVTASGSQPLTYQWQSRPSASGSFGNIAAATSASYTKTNAQLTDSGSQYRVLVSNSVQSNVPSNAATLTVTQAASSGGTAPQAPDVTGINNRTFTTRDDIVIPTVAGATGFNWDISAASGQQPATSGQQPATSGQQPVASSQLLVHSRRLATGGWQLATGSPVPTTAARLPLSSFALTPGAYVLQVQATNNAGASPWASAKISVVQADFSAIRVYPNPWKKDKHDGHDITFDNLTANSTVKIFTIAGHLVRELPAGSVGAHSSAPNQSPAAGQQVWDLKNDKGDSVASGIYVYVVTDGSGNKKRGKVALVR